MVVERLVPDEVEEAPARELPPRLLHHGRAVVVEAVAEVAARVAGEADRISREEIEVLGEGQDTPALLKTLLDALGDGGDLRGHARLLGHGARLHHLAAT